MTATVASGGPPILTRVVRLEAHDWADFLRAQWSVARASLLLRWRRQGGGVTVRGPRETERSVDVTPRDAERARQLSVAVDRASRWGPFRPRCLTRAVALQQMLVSEGLDAGDVRIGVHRDPEGFAAHAWVDYGGMILGDAPERVAKYSTLDGLDVFPGR